MSFNKDTEKNEIPKQETVFGVLRNILPKREQWRFEALKILFSSKKPISSYKVTKLLNKIGLKTSVSSVHPLFDAIVESGLCYRNPEWEKVGRKCVVPTSRGKELYEILKLKLDNGSTNSQ